MYSKSKLIAAGFAGAFACTIANMSQPASATLIVGACNVPMLAYKTSDGFHSTSSSSFVPVPGTNVTFTQGGTKAGCAVVDFSGQAYANGNAIVSLNIVFDDREQPDTCTPPTQPQFMTNNAMWSMVNSITFICRNVAPGAHSVYIEYRSANGGTVELDRPMIIVHHQ